MRYEFLQLIDKDTLELFMDNLYELVKVPSGIADTNGTIIAANKEGNVYSNYPCFSNRLKFINSYENSNQIFREKNYHIFRNTNGLAYIEVPISINGKCIAYLISGHFSLEESEIAYYNNLAEEETYYKEKNTVNAIVSNNKVESAIRLLLQFRDIISFIAIRHFLQLKTQEKLDLSRNRFDLIVEGAKDAIWEWNIKRGEFFISEKWKDITGRNLPKNYNLFDEIIKIAHPEDIKKINLALQTHIEGITEFFECEYRVETKVGAYKWIQQKGKLLKDSLGRHVLMAGSITDITNKKIYEEEINYLAYYDVVTNLPNRIFFEKKLNEELNKLNKSELKIAFLFIDMDDFKKINDAFGHEVGDKFLSAIANRFQDVVERNQLLCRFGGDEFVLAIWEYEDVEKLNNKAIELINVSNKALKIEDKEIYPSLSVGISYYNENWGSVADCLKYSDIAMYKAKKMGKNRYVMFDKDLYEEYIKGRRLELDLTKALKNNEFVLYYQPQVDIANEKIYGVEALLRWNHPEFGILSPARFIDILENSKMVSDIGRFVLKEACITLSNLYDLGCNDICVSINICEKQLMDSSFLGYVEETIKSSNINPRNICFEITERMLLNESKTILDTLDALRNMGIDVFIDDFGTKYSSLNYLNVFNVSGIKIDKSFIDKINDYKKDFIITKNIVKLAQDLNMQVIAEGVESKDQLNCLRDMNCSNIQGFLFSKPICNESLVHFINKFSYKG